MEIILQLHLVIVSKTPFHQVEYFIVNNGIIYQITKVSIK